MIQLDGNNYKPARVYFREYDLEAEVNECTMRPTTNFSGFYDGGYPDLAWLLSDGRVITMYVSTDGCETCGHGSGTFFTSYIPKDAPPTP